MRHAVLALLVYAGLVLADTEILNFSSDLKNLPDVVFPFAQSTLSQQNNSAIFGLAPSQRHTVRAEELRDGLCSRGNEGQKYDNSHLLFENLYVCEGDFWLALDLDSWFTASSTGIPWYYKPLVKDTRTETKFTLRISWPASTPAEFTIKLFSLDYFLSDMTPQQKGSTELNGPTRRLFARIRSSATKFRRAPRPDGSVLPFQFTLFPKWFLPAPEIPEPDGRGSARVVKFHVILEPLILGVLPESLLPGLGFMLCLVVPAILFVVPRINAEMEKLANRARKGKGKVE
ncbi:hypothetical protein CPB86DRAFT_814939 [Serendipita vermifera]|nr:hypothetical protein CPB86DRAFT_814939 [Serendipita vermifera]